jgi:hypothetical protein
MTTEHSTPPASTPISHDEVICSLFEGDYHIGLAVLINSIARAGFTGLFWIGYRGSLPPWTGQLVRRADGVFEVGSALLHFQLVDTERHFSQLKPDFMARLFSEGIAPKYLWYFDPDITVRCDWGFYQRWIGNGVCLCQENNMGTMSSDHPLRCEWIELARAANWGEPVQVQERYYNSGFVALPIEHREFLQVWSSAAQLANAAGVDQDSFLTQSRASTFYTVDQDTMNIAAMYSDVPLSTVGPEGMGWVAGGFTMYHSIGKLKPWRKKFLRAALMGDPPSNGDKHFLRSADGPIHPFTPGKLKSIRFASRVASLLGRFNRRT